MASRAVLARGSARLRSVFCEAPLVVLQWRAPFCGPRAPFRAPPVTGYTERLAPPLDMPDEPTTEDAMTLIYVHTPPGGPEPLRDRLLEALDIAEAFADIDTDIEFRVDFIDALFDNGVVIGKRQLVAYCDAYGLDDRLNQAMQLIANPESDLQHVIAIESDDGHASAVASTALTHGLDVHIVPGGPDVSREMSDVMTRRAGVGEAWSGRPPLGFDVEDGHLVESDRYGEVVAVLRLVRDGKLSKRAGADELDTSRRTIGRCLDNRERYGLAD